MAPTRSPSAVPRPWWAAVAISVALAACSASGRAVRAVAWQPGPPLVAPAGVVAEVRALVASSTGGWIAVGNGHVGDTDQQPLWWTSTDGRLWTAGTTRSVTNDGPRSGLIGVAATSGGVEALGAAFSPIHGNARPLVWRGDAPGVLAEVPITRELFGGPRTIGVAAIAGGPAGYAVVGNYLTGGTWLGGTSVDAPTVWTSATGATWTRLQGPGAPTVAATEIAVVRGVVTAGRGLVMFGDSTPLRVGVGTPALWCSTATSWTRVPPDATGAAPGRTTVLRAGAARSDGSVVIAGVESDPSGADPRPVVFTSGDCTRWARRPLGAGHGAVTVFDAAAAGDRAVVAWGDAGGLHLTELDPGRTRDLSVPDVAGPVTGVHVAATGAFLVLAVDTATGVAPFTAGW